MEQVVVHQVPAPALVIAAQQGHVALALHGCALGGDADHRHRPQRALPPDLPRVPPFREADLAAGAVGALGDGVAMQGEAVLLHVNVSGAVYGAEAVLEGLQLVGTTQGGQLGTVTQPNLRSVSRIRKYNKIIKSAHLMNIRCS